MRRTLALSSSIILAGVALAGCHPPNQNPSDEKVDTAASFSGDYLEGSATASASATAGADTETTASSTVVAPTGDDIRVKLSEKELTDGQPYQVKVTGLNPEQGYYAAVCAAAGSDVTPTPYCTGEQGDVQAQAWLQNPNGTVQIQPDGSAEFTLTARATGQDVDCHTQQCIFKIFGDHTNGLGDVTDTDIPVTFTH